MASVSLRYKGATGSRSPPKDLDRSELRLHNGVLYLFAYVPDFLKTYQPRRANEVTLERTQDHVDIEAVEDCFFWCRQRMMQYGSNVQILQPSWLAADICQEFEQAVQRYSQLKKPDIQ